MILLSNSHILTILKGQFKKIKYITTTTSFLERH